MSGLSHHGLRCATFLALSPSPCRFKRHNEPGGAICA
jgi:hypothetical protein